MVLAATAASLSGCASDRESETVAVPRTIVAALAPVEVSIAPGPGIALGDAATAFNRGDRPVPGEDVGGSEPVPPPADEGSGAGANAPDDTLVHETLDDVVDDTSPPSQDPSESADPAAEAPSATRLPDDSPECLAVAKVAATLVPINALSQEFNDKYDAASPEEQKMLFSEEFPGVLAAIRKLLPPVETALVALADVAPELQPSVEAFNTYTTAFFAAFDAVEAETLAEASEAVAAELDDVSTAGLDASDTIDAYTQATCDRTFDA